jgi:hypothetical protein
MNQLQAQVCELCILWDHETLFLQRADKHKGSKLISYVILSQTTNVSHPAIGRINQKEETQPCTLTKTACVRFIRASADTLNGMQRTTLQNEMPLTSINCQRQKPELSTVAKSFMCA